MPSLSTLISAGAVQNVATNLSAAESYAEGAAAAQNLVDIVVDVNLTAPITATLTLSNTALGSLSANDGAGYNAGTGVWTITGTAAAVNTALANVTFTPVVNDFSGSFSIATHVADSATHVASGTKTVTVTAVNDLPVAAPDHGSTTSEDAIQIFTNADLVGNDTDVDSDDLQVVAVASVSNFGAAVTVDAQGDVTYDPAGALDYLSEGVGVTDTFTYTVSDGHGGTDTASVAVYLAGVNDAPVAGDDAPVAIGEAAVPVDLTATLLANDTDAEIALTAASIVGVGSSAHGASIIFTPGVGITYNTNHVFDGLADGQHATDTFTYTIVDASGAQSSATVTMTINGVSNNLPVAADDDLRSPGMPLTIENSPVHFGPGEANLLVSNDTDPDLPGFPFTGADIVATSPLSSHGATLTPDTGTSVGVTYDPSGALDWLASGETTTDTFTYTVSDGLGGVDSASVFITVGGINDAPVVTGGGATMAYTEGDAAAVISNTIIVNDPDNNDLLTTATVSIAANYQNGADFLSFTNDGLTMGDIAGVFNAGAGYIVLTSAGGATDAEMTAALQAVSYHNTSDAPSTLDRSIQFVVSDGSTTSFSATATISITAVNDAPVAIDDHVEGAISTPENTPIVFTNVHANILAGNDTDPDQPGFPFSGADIIGFSPMSAGGATLTPDSGTTSGVTDNTLTYNPGTALDWLAAGETYIDALYYTLSDGSGGTDTASVFITVSGVNDAVVAVDEGGSAVADVTTTFTAASLLANDQDVDLADTHTIISVNGAHATLVGGDVVFNPAGDYDFLADGSSSAETFTYVVSDGHGATDTGTVTVAVQGVNDAPVVAGPIADQTIQSLGATGVFSLDVSAAFTDADSGDSVTYSADLADGSALPAWLAFDANTKTFSNVAPIPEGALGNDVFSVRVTGTDLALATTTDTFTLTVTPSNFTPVAVDHSADVTEDNVTTASGNLLLGASDADTADTLSLLGVNTNTGSYGTLVTTTTTGDYTYNLNAGYQALGDGESATDTFVYTITDGAGGTATADLSITVHGVNDRPVLNTAGATTLADVAEDSTDPAGQTVASFASAITSDPDASAVKGVAITGYFAGGPKQVTSDAATESEVDVASDAAGNLFAAYVHDGNVYTKTYNALTQTWSAESLIGAGSGPAVAFGNGASTHLAFAGSDGNVYYSVDSGVPTVVAAVANAVHVDIGADANDFATVVFQAQADGDGYQELFKYDNGGGGFAGGMFADGWYASFTGYYPTEPVIAIEADGTEHLAFTYTNYHTNAGWSDEVMVYQIDGANQPATGILNSNNTYTIPTKGLAIDAGGNAQLLYALNGAYFVADTTGGAWTTTALPGGISNPSLAIDAATGDTIVTYISGGVAYSASSADGFTTPTALNILGTSPDTPVVAASGDVVYLASDGSDTEVFHSAVGATPSIGTFEYSTDGGLNWAAIDDGSLSDTHALVLRSTDMVRFVPAAEYSGATPTLSFKAWDQSDGATAGTYADSTVGGATSAYSTATEDAGITVTVVNDAPTANATGVFTYTEGDAPAVVDGTIAINDIDSANLVGATAQISAGAQVGDVLAFVDGGGITGNWNAVTHTLTLSGSASVATYQTALRSITYENTADPAMIGGTRTVTWTVNDGTDSSATTTSTVNVSVVNSAPIALNDSTTVSQDTTIISASTFLGNDSDPEGGALSIVSVGLGGQSDWGVSVSIDGSGDVVYGDGTQWDALTASSSTSDTFHYTVSDGNDTDTAVMTLYIQGVNDAPDQVVSADPDAWIEYSTNTITQAMLEFDDVDNDYTNASQLTYTLTTLGTLGDVMLNSVILDVGGTFTQADINNGLVEYANNGRGTVALSGMDTIGFTVEDQHGATTAGSFSTTIYRDNGAPDLTLLSASTVAVSEHSGFVTPYVNLASSVSLTDVDSALSLNGGSVTVAYNVLDTAGSGDTLFFIDPVNQKIQVMGSDVQFNTGTVGSPVWVTIGAIDGVNDGQGGNDLQVNLNADGGFNVSVVAVRHMIQALSFGTSDPGLDVARSLTITVSDGEGSVAKTDFVNVNLNITAVNDAPVFSSATTANFVENDPTTSTVIDVNVTDEESDTFGFSIVGGADSAAFSIDAVTGVLTFNASPNFESASDTNSDNVYEVQVRAEDTNDAASFSVQTVLVTVTDTNDAPTITSTSTTSVNENTTAVMTLDGTDEDGDTLTWNIVGGADAALFSLNATTGQLAFLAAPNFESASDTNSDNDYMVQVRATDGNSGTDTMMLTVTVANVAEPAHINLAPTDQVFMGEDTNEYISGPGMWDISDEDSTTVDVTFAVAHGSLTFGATLYGATTDVVGDTVTLTGIALADLATVLNDVSGLAYQPDPGYNGADTLQVTVNGGAPAATASVAILVGAETDEYIYNETSGALSDANGTSYTFVPNFDLGNGDYDTVLITNASASQMVFSTDGTDTTLTGPNNTLQISGLSADLDDTRIFFDDGSVLKTNLDGLVAATLIGRNAAGGDQLVAGSHGDVLMGLGGNDLLVGGDGNDVIYGGSGLDDINGGAGNDTISGGQGDEALTGGLGADTFVYTARAGSANDGNDTIGDFADGEDLIYVSDVSLVQATANFATFITIGDTVGDGSGDALLTFLDGNTVTLTGVLAADINQSDFLFYGQAA